MRLKEVLRFERLIRSATFSKKAAKWFVSVQVDAVISAKSRGNDALGIDLCVNSFAHASDGISIVASKPLGKILKAFRREDLWTSSPTGNRLEGSCLGSNQIMRLSNVLI